jgi:hypothetical protein
MALMGLGLPWQAALGAVTLMTSVAWAPALLLGGVSLLWARRQQGVEQGAAHGAAQGALPAAA